MAGPAERAVEGTTGAINVQRAGRLAYRRGTTVRGSPQADNITAAYKPSRATNISRLIGSLKIPVNREGGASSLTESRLPTESGKGLIISLTVPWLLYLLAEPSCLQ